MSSLRFPRVKLSRYDKLWLEAVFSKSNEFKRPTFRTLFASLYGKLPVDFDPYGIDTRILREGNQLTLLGIWRVDPRNRVFEQTDRLLRWLRNQFLKTPEMTHFSVE